MDKKKHDKEEKIGADGLTKKERRALKVQARQTDDDKSKQKQTQIHSVQKTISTERKEIEVCLNENEKKGTIESTNITNAKTMEKSECALSEKEKRKLEWQQKLSQQNKAQNKHNSENINIGITKAEMKAKRREIQEAQRQAKVTSKTNIEFDKTKKIEATVPNEGKSEVTEVESKSSNKRKSIKYRASIFRKSTHSKKQLHGSIQLLNHLYPSDTNSSEFENSVCFPNIHPAFIQLGVQYSTKTILGSNARCLSLLSALNTLINDLKTPKDQEFCRYLESVLQNCTDYLHKCRPMAVSMQNALRIFKMQLIPKLTQDRSLSDEEKKEKLFQLIENYIQDQIMTAGRAISLKVLEKISDGDIILTYGCSSLIKRILIDAFTSKKRFRVIVVDGRPLCEGREMLRRLTVAGIKCTYILINELSYVMPNVTKVLLGAHALLANGYVMSRIGTAQVALASQAYNKPVLVCCETYKFSEKVKTDSLVYNEIGEPDELLRVDTSDQPSPLRMWKTRHNLTPLNLLYDVTPPDLVSAVVTELAILPCTSVPVVLRLKPIEI